MALLPKINICLNSKCDKIDIYEETGIYHDPNNLTGWGSFNPDTQDIDESYLYIYDITGTTLLQTYVLKDGSGTDVYSGASGEPIPSAFLALVNQTWNQGDGMYKLVYEVKTTQGLNPQETHYNDPQRMLFTCSLENCIDTIKASIITECDSVKLEKQKDKLDQLQIILLGIQSAFACGDFTTAQTLLDSGTKICENLCDCGCGDC